MNGQGALNPDEANQSAIPPHAQPWIYAAAVRLGLNENEARIAAQKGAISLPSLSLQMQQFKSGPEPQWLVLALLTQPAKMSESIWIELLLRANCAIAAMSACTAAIDDQGDALLVYRLLPQSYSDAMTLGSELLHIVAVAESLIGGAVALSTPLPAAGPDLGNNAGGHKGQSFMPASGAFTEGWHSELIGQALRHLGNIQPVIANETICAIRLDQQTLEIIADADGRHLLISTPCSLPTRSYSQRIHALSVNFHLMALTGCSLALAPEGACLQGRWNSRQLNGEDLANWMMDFAQLAASLRLPSPKPASRF